MNPHTTYHPKWWTAMGLAAIAVTCVLVYCLWGQMQSSIVGVWKAVDDFGHEHYFEFHKDGTLIYWNRFRSPDGSFKDMPRFQGSYLWMDLKTVAAKSNGFPQQPLGTLILVSDNELKQRGGEALRDNLVYIRVQ